MSSNYAGFQQYVAQDTTDILTAALVLLGVETTLSSAFVTVYSPGGAELVSRTSATISGHRASYSRTWAEANFAIDYGYKAKFELLYNSDADTKEINVYFDVVRRRFESMVGTSDLQKIEPRLVNPSGSSDLSQFLNEAWERISTHVSQKLGIYAGNVFHPERFRKAHIYLALGQYFRSVQFGSTGTADADKSRQYFVEGMKEVSNILSSLSVDRNDDGLIGDSERNQASNRIRAWR